METNGDVWAAHGHPGEPCSPPEAVHGQVVCFSNKAESPASAEEPRKHLPVDCWCGYSWDGPYR